MNGNLVPKAEATVSVYDHGFLYGDGIFEGIRVYNGRIFRLRDHLYRLYESAHSIMLTIDYTLDEMEKAVIETVKANGLRDAYIRLVISRGPGDLGLNPKNCEKSQVVIIVDHIALYPAEVYTEGITVITVPTRRNLTDALDPKIKSLNYLNNILARIEAERAGVMEALMLNNQGYVSEGTADNVFIMRRGVLKTPPAYMGILEGITRELVMDLARESGIAVKEVPLTRHDFYVADECFLTGTAAELMPVIGVDGRQVGNGKPGPVTGNLIDAYRELTRTEGEPVL